jgi:hypothetical protein
MSCHKIVSSLVKDKIFIETGTGGGRCIPVALQYGAIEVHSIEIDPIIQSKNLIKFAQLPEVFLYTGDSITWLPKILEKIRYQCVFLLDAHIMSMDWVHGEKICPVLKELEIILDHGKRNKVRHTLIIDDRKLFNGKTQSFENISVNDITKTILFSNPSYEITFSKRAIVAR